MKAAVTTFKEGLCFICSEEAENRINAGEFINVPCHKDCWDEACCNLVEFPEGRISNEEFKKLTGVDISHICYVSANGSKRWYLDGNYHREGGPAVEEAGGIKQWWLNDEIHREDGPAYEGSDGYKEWWLENNELSERDHAAAMSKRNGSCDGKIVEIEGKKCKLTDL